jgi:nucleoside-diphosphate-sugar epimerase
MVAGIGRAAGLTPRVERGPARPGDVERTWADLARARAELGYAPKTSFEDGLAAQWAWIRANPS